MKRFEIHQRGWWPLILWLLVAYGLCLIPSGCFDWVKALLALESNGHSTGLSVDLLEWASHAILMAGVAFHLVRIFSSSSRRLPPLVYAMLGVLAIAASIEGLQALLPPEFHRGPSISDIWASVLGGLVGACAALKFKRAPVEPAV